MIYGGKGLEQVESEHTQAVIDRTQRGLPAEAVAATKADGKEEITPRKNILADALNALKNIGK